MALATRPLGKTGMEITRVGFGAWAIGGAGWKYAWGNQDDAESVSAIHHAVDRGINWIDTAAVYGWGHSEEVVGRAVSALTEPDRPYIFTKGGMVPRSGDLEAEPLRSGRPESLRSEVEASLRRLGVERIDLYQMHWPAEDAALEDYWGVLLELRAEGKLRAAGLCNHSADQLDQAERLGHVDSLQPPFSVVRRRVAERELQLCRHNDTGVIVYSPMESGLLTGAFSQQRLAALPENDWRRTSPIFTKHLDAALTVVEAFRQVADRHQTTVASVAVAWTLAWPGVTGAIVGARRPEQVDGWLDAADLQLTDADLDAIARSIDQAHLGHGPLRPE